jgi:hypothetical protein
MQKLLLLRRPEINTITVLRYTANSAVNVERLIGMFMVHAVYAGKVEIERDTTKWRSKTSVGSATINSNETCTQNYLALSLSEHALVCVGFFFFFFCFFFF